LPLCRGLAYLHIALVKEGIETQWVGHDMMEDETIKNAMDYIQQRKTSRLVNSLT
jgi:lipid A disaccharide synthetase